MVEQKLNKFIPLFLYWMKQNEIWKSPIKYVSTGGVLPIINGRRTMSQAYKIVFKFLRFDISYIFLFTIFCTRKLLRINQV